MKFKGNKILSIFLSFTILVSICICAFTITAAGKEITYYVKATGSDSASGLSTSAPLQTVSKAIEKAVSGNFAADDTVYVNLMDYTSINWGTARNYDFKLVVRANDDSLRNTVTLSDGFTFGGDTAFENVIVGNITNINYGDKSVSFDEDCTFVATNHFLGKSTAVANETVTTAQTVSLGNTVVSKNFRLSGKTVDNKTYKEDVSVVFSDEKSAPAIYLTAESGKTVFEKDLNVNIMDSKSVEILASGGTVSVGGAFQFIINSNTKISGESRNVLNSVSAAGGFYYITNASGVYDLINTTETAGRYDVNTDRYKVIATDTKGNQTVAENGILTLPAAGQYTITAVKFIETETYYVSPEGSDENDGVSSSTPVATIAKAVELANTAGYLEGDLITVKVIRSDSTGVELGVLPRYYFDLVVESNSTSASLKSKIIVISGENIANNKGAQTTYKNIEISNNSDQWRTLCLANSNVKFDENTKFSFGFGTALVYGGKDNDGGATTTIDGQSVEFDCTMPYAVCLANGSWSGRTYTEDLNLTVNNSSTNTFIHFNSYYSEAKSGSTTYKKNVNLNFKSMKGVRLSQFDGATFEGAIQIINSAGLGWDTAYDSSVTAAVDPTINEALANVDADKYLIKNDTGNADILTFTKTAGKYAVDTDKYKLAATDTSGKTYLSANGYLVLEPGIYTVTCLHEHSYTDDCDETCNSCDDIRINAHTYTNVCDAICNICGIVRTNNHSYDNGCDTDCNVCFVTRITSHMYKNDCDADCDICGEVRVVAEHVYDSDCDAFCNKCDLERVPYHIYTNNCDATCNVCGGERTPDSHVYSHDCDTVCNVCAEVRTVEHIFTNVCDKSCNVCGFMRKSSHTYDNQCDVECNVCLAQRSVSHIYANPCDERCNVCENIRSNIHKYDNNCDADCNICGDIRTPSEHIFSSACDIDCAECGLVRQTAHRYYEVDIANASKHWKQCEFCGLKSGLAEHTFDDECDRKCDECGYIRTVEGHDFDSECDTTCSKCEYIRATVHTYSFDCDNNCENCDYIRQGVDHIGGMATCKSKAVCDICGKEYGEKSNTNHTGGTDYRNKVTATCGTDGYEGDITCLGCNKKFADGKVIPATELHTYDNDCDTECSVCNKTRITKHYYSPVTCTAAEKCYICGAIGQAALGHNYVIKVQKATLTKDGFSYEECSECKKVINKVTTNKIQSIELSATSFVYDGQEKKPAVIVIDSAGKTVSADYYTVTYDQGIIDVGSYNVTVRFNTLYSGKHMLGFTIIPAATTLGEVNASGNMIDVAVDKQDIQTTGYQIQYSLSAEFTNAKVKTINDVSVTNAILKALKFDTVYYVRVRTYKNIGGEKFYSDWSDYKQVKTQ